MIASFGSDEKEVGVVRQDAQQNRADEAIDSHAIVTTPVAWVVLQGIGDEGLSRAGVVPAEHHEMAHGLSGDVVVVIVRFACAVIEVGRAQTREDGDAAFEEAANQARCQFLVVHLSAQTEEVEICVGRDPQFGIALELALCAKALGQIDAIPPEPRRIEDLQIVRIAFGAVASSERVASEPNGESPPLVQRPHLVDGLLQADRVAVVSVDRVETGGAARRVVGLRRHFERELVRPWTRFGRPGGPLPPTRFRVSGHSSLRSEVRGARCQRNVERGGPTSG